MMDKPFFVMLLTQGRNRFLPLTCADGSLGMFDTRSKAEEAAGRTVSGSSFGFVVFGDPALPELGSPEARAIASVKRLCEDSLARGTPWVDFRRRMERRLDTEAVALTFNANT